MLKLIFSPMTLTDLLVRDINSHIYITTITIEKNKLRKKKIKYKFFIHFNVFLYSVQHKFWFPINEVLINIHSWFFNLFNNIGLISYKILLSPIQKIFKLWKKIVIKINFFVDKLLNRPSPLIVKYFWWNQAKHLTQ